MSRVRIGAVSYLNSKPLIEGLAELAPEAELILDYPSRLTQALDAGRLDVALVPVVTCFLRPGFEIVGDACVATRGPVLSVKLFSRVAPSQIHRLALDEGSRTSAILAQVLLRERFGMRPELESLPVEADVSKTTADAIVLIGDRCIEPPAEQFACTWDLGEEWTRHTGLPFVFAVWATRTGTDLGAVEEALAAARDLGIGRLPEISRREAPRLGLGLQTTVDYLTQNLYYRLGSSERAGLGRFHQLAVRQHLAPEGVDLVFRNYATLGEGGRW